MSKEAVGGFLRDSSMKAAKVIHENPWEAILVIGSGGTSIALGVLAILAAAEKSKNIWYYVTLPSILVGILTIASLKLIADSMPTDNSSRPSLPKE